MTDERWIPSDKDELISAIESEWNLLIDLAAKLDVHKMISADLVGWSPKDHLAHLTEWMKILMGFYMDLRRAHDVMGMSPEVTQNWDFESKNNLLFERNRHRSVNDVLDELKYVYGELIVRLSGISFEELEKPQHPFDPEKIPLLLYVLRGTTEHFAEHRKRIEKHLQEGM
jgi:hypothetical protein